MDEPNQTSSEASQFKAELPGEWEPVGKFRDWATLGYFESLLHRHEIPTGVERFDHYSALDGFWGEILVLFVPADQADSAHSVLDAELEDEEANVDVPAAPEAAPTRWSERAFPESSAVHAEPRDEFQSDWGIGWFTPAVCLLFAGGLGYLTWQWLRPAPADGPRTQEALRLWQALQELNLPLESPDFPGRSQQRLWYDAERGDFVLEEDRDGDGFPEKTRRFGLEN